MSNEKPNKGTILLVDDNLSNLQVLIDYLNKSGYKTLVARSGDRAIRQLKFVRPDLILLDIIMPGIDGYETCRQLKEDKNTKDIPVIFITALVETYDKVRGFKVGAVDFITKPFQHEEVLARVTTHLTIQRQKKQLSELNAMKDKFFSIIAHDLRNAFGGILSISRIMAESLNIYEKEELELFSQSIYETAQKTFNLLENLLNWARIQRGTMEFRPNIIDLHKPVSENISLFKENASQKKINLSHSIEPKTYICADPNMTDAIFRNLISNAIKFTYEGGEVRITAENDGENVKISVSDTGEGISEKDIQKLFRIDESYKRPGTAGEEGTGLGLMLCKEFVEKNNGEIRVESELGKGTTFSFSLPKRERDHTREGIPDIPAGTSVLSSESAPEDSFLSGETKSGIRILIVEDEPLNRQMLFLILRNLGFQADTASNGREAIRSLESKPYDIVLMDIEMPKMNGVEATRIIRDTRSDVLNHHIPVIAMSAHTAEEDQKHFIEAGMNGYISKPIESQTILEIVKKYANNSGVQK
ncbi:response regulator [Desulfobacterales bacterium HSG2]|nr:response regulator [Desulfobacterales bacterium HSG2]